MINEKMLHRLRKRAGLSQSELAEKIGTHRVTISAVERGVRRIDTDLLESWLRACGAHLELVEGQSPTVNALSEMAESMSTSQAETLLEIAKLLPVLSPHELETIRILLHGWSVRKL